MKSAIQRVVVVLSGVLAFLPADSLAQPAAPATNQATLRVLIITGGHDHEAGDDNSQRAERILVAAERIGAQPHRFAAPRRRRIVPLRQRALGIAEHAFVIGQRGGMDVAEQLATALAADQTRRGDVTKPVA